jgi:glycosyltransferase involved in cell wall biosynthesis
MGRGAAVLYLGTPENEEVAGGSGLSYSSEVPVLRSLIERLSAMPVSEREAMGRRAAAAAADRYDWERVTTQYEALFSQMIE